MRNKSNRVLRNLYLDQDIYEYHELEYDGRIIKPGDLIQIKGRSGNYRYLRHAHNIKLDTTWVDTIHVKTDSFQSFRIDQIKRAPVRKRSRSKKVDK